MITKILRFFGLCKDRCIEKKKTECSVDDSCGKDISKEEKSYCPICSE